MAVVAGVRVARDGAGEAGKLKSFMDSHRFFSTVCLRVPISDYAIEERKILQRR